MISRDPADSNTTGHILLIALAVFLGMILLVFCLALLSGFFEGLSLAPPLFKVTSVIHTSPSGTMNLASRIFIENTVMTDFKNRDLMAEFYRNGKELYAKIYTLHGEGFIPTQHIGVATMGGSGCRGEYFSPGEKIEINLKNGQYYPGDMVELRIYEKTGDTASAPILKSVADPTYLDEWVREYFYPDHKGYRIISQHKVRA